jgi:hypothetical protein
MAMLLLLQLLSQDGTVQLDTITAGNSVPNGSYLITIPDNCLYVGEGQVAYVYQTMGVASIPNCVGIFISETRAYSVIVQHFPYQAFKLEPVIEDIEFTVNFQYRHLYKQVPYAGESEAFIPPTLDEAASSFAFGMHYYNTQANAGYFAKKVWVSDQDALLFTLTSSEEGYLVHQTEIESIFQSVTPNENASRLEPVGEPVSYLDLIGLNLKQPETPAAGEPQGLPSSVIYTSIGLAVGAIMLLVIAALVQKKNKRAPVSEPHDAQA